VTRLVRGIIVVASCLPLMGTLWSPVHGQSVVTLAPDVSSTAQHVTPVAYLVLGSAAGWLAGMLAGATLGFAARSESDESFIATESLIGAWIGSSVGSACGAHLANGSRGRVGWGMAASFAIVPVAALVATPFPGGIVAVPSCANRHQRHYRTSHGGIAATLIKRRPARSTVATVAGRTRPERAGVVGCGVSPEVR
jgi:hypothetical protein